MSARSGATVGEELAPVTQKHEIATSIAYAGASGDTNPLHYDPAFAAHVSPTGGVIAHGMYSMGLASRVLTAWAGGPEAVQSIKVRFSKPWPTGGSATFGGTVESVEDGVATVNLWGKLADDTPILGGTGLVRLG